MKRSHILSCIVAFAGILVGISARAAEDLSSIQKQLEKRKGDLEY